jgi:hypothetical protein
MKPLLLPALAILTLSGCCSFMPCHRGTYIAGEVTDAVTGRAIPGASVSLYDYEVSSAPSGCFSLGGPDALPFEFRVSASGYKPVVSRAVPGKFQASIRLAPGDNADPSTSNIREISRDQYDKLSSECPSRASEK